MARSRTITRVVRVKARRRAHRKFTIPLAMVAGFAPLVIVGVKAFQKAGPTYAVQEMTCALTGYSIPEHKFYPGQMMNGTVPLLLGIILHKVVGSKFGVNKMLAQANVPLLRL